MTGWVGYTTASCFVFLNQTCLTTIKVKFEIYKNRYCDVFFFFQSDAISSDRAGSSHPLPLPSPITKGPSLNKPTFCFFNS